MERLSLRQALSVLSKSSSYAVSTDTELSDSELDSLKKCLYVTTDIEEAFANKLCDLAPGSILFLCGSSGDGKSELLTKYKKKHAHYVDFHLDATHSFGTKTSAIQTLDELFTKSKKSGRTLVVGVNVGMLGNYEKEGREEHSDIKTAIGQFLKINANIEDEYCSFLSFESFPKFVLENAGVRAKFFQSILNRVVRDDYSNKFNDYFKAESGSKKEAVLISNFLLLRDRLIQKKVVELLLLARIKRDQFITARMLLDFIYCILTGPGYLFDNLFNGGDNELLAVISEFDPAIIRDKTIDEFILHHNLQLHESEFHSCMQEISKKYEFKNSVSSEEASSLVRLFYILKYTQLKTSYLGNFNDSLDDEGLELYKELWAAHKEFDGSQASKKGLKKYYENTIKPAIRLYINRNQPGLPKNEYFLSSHGKNFLSTEIDIAIDYDAIEKDECDDISHFNLHLKIAGEPLKAIPVSVNLLTLMMDISLGYRPNKHDKNSVVLLEDLACHIVSLGISSPILKLNAGEKSIQIKNTSDGDIEVSGL